MTANLQRWASRVLAWLRAGRLDEDFAAELDSHVEMQAEEYVRRGLPPGEARRLALVRLGSPTALQQAHRDSRGLPLLDAVLQDIRFAWRLIARDPWFSAAAVLAIALGIGANTVGFTIVNAAFLRGFGFDDGDRLFAVSWNSESGRRRAVSLLELEEWRSASQSFSSLAGYVRGAMNISDDRSVPEQTQGAQVTANHFDVLHVTPLAGRTFQAVDETPGAEPVVIISDTLWRDRFGRDPATIGGVLRVDGQPRTIVGIMPAGMLFPEDSSLWVPYAPARSQLTRTNRPLSVFGRLAPSTTPASADGELQALGRRMKADHPDAMSDVSGVRIETFVQRYLGGAARPMFITVMGAVILVLAIACVNVANLLLARSVYRAREIAVRFSMGATRWRVIRQLLVESIMLSGLGGALGLPLAWFAVRAFDAAVQRTGPPYWLVFTMDSRVLVYVAAVCVVTGIVFGLAPALHVSRTNNHDVLKDGGRGTAGARRSRRFSAVMVVAELALTIVLLCGAALMLRSFIALASVDTGIEVTGLMRMRLQLPPEKYPGPAGRLAFFDALEPRLAAIPGLEGAAVTTGVPPLAGESRRLQVDARPEADPVFVSTVIISPEYFDVVGVPVARGRAFTARDGQAGAETVVVNQALASKFFPGEDAIGRRIRFVRHDDDDDSQVPDEGWRTIVGVSGRILQGPSVDAFRAEVVYLPFRQEAPRTASLLVRSALPPESVMAAVRGAVQAVDRDQPVFTVQTVDQLLREEQSIYRIFAVLFGLLAAIALTLSSVGLYAVMAYAVTQRTQEIGVRVAIGAQRWQVSWLFLRSGLAQLAMSLVLGLPVALTLARVARLRLVEVEPADPPTLVGITLLLSAVAVAACLVPARRASRVDPVEALRAD
jgi:predicted permease